jgi:hypothetical protein
MLADGGSVSRLANAIQPIVRQTDPMPGRDHDSVLFDLDGVLVDSRAAITGCINHALVEHEFPARPPGICTASSDPRSLTHSLS